MSNGTEMTEAEIEAYAEKHAREYPNGLMRRCGGLRKKPKYTSQRSNNHPRRV